jgi:hypothetical protein
MHGALCRIHQVETVGRLCVAAASDYRHVCFVRSTNKTNQGPLIFASSVGCWSVLFEVQARLLYGSFLPGEISTY